MITDGSFQFFQREPVGDFYDAQAHALLHGHWNIPRGVLNIEAFITNGKAYMYFGPVPAILRMPLLVFTHRFDGRLTQVSMTVAFLLALFFASRLSWRIRELLRNGEPMGRFEVLIASSFIALLGSGSVLLFLGSQAFVYHEDILWGIALSLGAYESLLAFIVSPSLRALGLAGLFTTMALLTRAPLGLGPLAAIGITLIAAVLARASQTHWWAGHRTRAISKGAALLGSEEPLNSALIVGLVLVVAIPVALYAWVNYSKFGTLFGLPAQRQVFTAINAHRRAALRANGGSLFGIKFIPSALVQYLRPDALSFDRLFPWVHFCTTPPLVIGHLLYDELDWSSSIPTTMPTFTVLGLVGVTTLLRRRGAGTRNGLPPLRVLVCGAAVGTVPTLAIAYMANRYLGDLLPVVLLSSLIGLHLLLARADRAQRSRPVKSVVVVLLLLGVFGLWVNVSLALSYQRLLSPYATSPQRSAFVSFQRQLYRSLGGRAGYEVQSGHTLPPAAEAGHLFILGNCDALYWSNGSEWFQLEGTPRAGRFRLKVTFPDAPVGTRQPLLVSGIPGNGSYLAVHYDRGGFVTFDYFFDSPGQPWSISSPYHVQPGKAYVIDAVIDPHNKEVILTVDNVQLLDFTWYVHSGDHFTLGSAPPGSPVAPAFTGRLQELPPDLSTCRLVKPSAR